MVDKYNFDVVQRLRNRKMLYSDNIIKTFYAIAIFGCVVLIFLLLSTKGFINQVEAAKASFTIIGLVFNLVAGIMFMFDYFDGSNARKCLKECVKSDEEFKSYLSAYRGRGWSPAQRLEFFDKLRENKELNDRFMEYYKSYPKITQHVMYAGIFLFALGSILQIATYYL